MHIKSAKTLSLRALLPAAALLLAACDNHDGNALTPPPDDSIPALALAQLEVGFVFDQPVHITHAGDGSDRLFVVERAGVVWIIDDDAVTSTPFLDITDRVLADTSERGLLSIAFPPGFSGDGHFYAYYTSLPGGTISAGESIVARFQVAGGIGDRDSEEILLSVPQPQPNHNGGQIAFGPDGYLYIALGDGGGAGDPDGNAQNLTTLLGALLRIDVEAATGPDYDIPPDNPFAGAQFGRDEIWAWGLRNPWRFSFDRATGDLYIGDVGQGRQEEINFQPAASTGDENYGWNRMEGLLCYPASVNVCDQAGLTRPIAVYNHGAGDCAVTGGFVYRGTEIEDLRGVYLYGDFCSGRIRGFRVNPTGLVQDGILLDTNLQISTFGEDETGSLHVADYAGGVIYRIEQGP